jgi:hypothetical protein
MGSSLPCCFGTRIDYLPVQPSNLRFSLILCIKPNEEPEPSAKIRLPFTVNGKWF